MHGRLIQPFPPHSSGSLEIWGGKWDSYAKGTHTLSFFKATPRASEGTHYADWFSAR